MRVTHSTHWDLTQIRAWQHNVTWSIQLAAAYQAHYGDMRQYHRKILLAYGDVQQAHARHITRYADLEICRKSARFPYWLMQQTAARHVLGYDIMNVNPVTKRLTASWSLLNDARLQAVANSPEMVWHGQTIRITQATLSCDEDSPVWIAQLEIAQIADFAAIGIGDSITLTLGLETFVLVVDGKTLSRESLTEQRCELSAVSPIALLDAPFAGTIRFYQPSAVLAESAVVLLIGAVAWQLPHWMIPAGRLMLENVTPLAAARNIVAAIGGIIESNPDGSIVCRRRHPVSIPQYSAAMVAHSLFDTDVISARAQIAPSRGFNRVTIANENGAAASSTDRIEFVADVDDAKQGTVRAYLSATRPVLLTHTGHAATVIAALGEITRWETETVEFVEGKASTRYPVTAIISSVWQHTDLGTVIADGKNLITATAGFSLLKITYTTTSQNWRVMLSLDEEVQFVLVEI